MLGSLGCVQHSPGNPPLLTHTIFRRQGGDYDGDKLLVVTHPAFVTPFNPAKADPAYADPPFRDSDWFEVDRRKVSDHVQPLVGTEDSSALARVFMEGLWAGTQYGMLSTAHTTLAYERGIQDPLTSEVRLPLSLKRLPR